MAVAIPEAALANRICVSVSYVVFQYDASMLLAKALPCATASSRYACQPHGQPFDAASSPDRFGVAHDHVQPSAQANARRRCLSFRATGLLNEKFTSEAFLYVTLTYLRMLGLLSRAKGWSLTSDLQTGV